MLSDGPAMVVTFQQTKLPDTGLHEQLSCHISSERLDKLLCCVVDEAFNPHRKSSHALVTYI